MEKGISEFSFSSPNWRKEFQFSLSLLDWTFWPLVNACMEDIFLFPILHWAWPIVQWGHTQVTRSKTCSYWYPKIYPILSWNFIDHGRQIHRTRIQFQTFYNVDGKIVPQTQEFALWLLPLQHLKGFHTHHCHWMNGWKATIDTIGFTMVLVWQTIGSNGFTMVFSPATIGTNGFSMVL